MKPIRRATHQVQIDHITVGSDHPVVIPSAVSVLVMDWMTTGDSEPTVIWSIWTWWVLRRVMWDMVCVVIVDG